MSSTFADFLREQVAKRKTETAGREEIIAEWSAALNDLYAVVRGWLRTSDPDGVLTVEDETWELKEQGLGTYTVPRIDIRGLGHWVGLVPKARYTVATATPPRKSTPERAAGRVDITDEVRRYILYRFRGEDGDLWLMDDQKTPLRVFDQPAFEAALKSYLQ